MTSIHIDHPHVLSAELKSDGNRQNILEVVTDLPIDPQSIAIQTPKWNAMMGAIERKRQQLPPQQKWGNVTYTNAPPVAE